MSGCIRVPLGAKGDHPNRKNKNKRCGIIARDSHPPTAEQRTISLYKKWQCQYKNRKIVNHRNGPDFRGEKRRINYMQLQPNSKVVFTLIKKTVAPLLT